MDINVDTLKQLSGGDAFYQRNLYDDDDLSELVKKDDEHCELDNLMLINSNKSDEYSDMPDLVLANPCPHCGNNK